MKKFNSYKEEKEYYERDATEQEFLKWYRKQDVKHYEKPSCTVDLIGLRFRDGQVQIMLVQRKHHPFKDKWALPGGFIEPNESINDAVIREVKEETNIDLGTQKVIRMPAVSAPGRDPRMWVITNPNIVLFTPDDQIKMNEHAGDDAENIEWVDLSLSKDNKLQIDRELAFDHKDIIERAFIYLKNDFNQRRMPLVTLMLGKFVTIPQMKKLYDSFTDKFAKMSTYNIRRYYSKSLKKTDNVLHTKSEKGGRSANIFEYTMKNIY